MQITGICNIFADINVLFYFKLVGIAKHLITDPMGKRVLFSQDHKH